MPTVNIHDGNWEVRRAYEVSTDGLAMRNLFNVTHFDPDPHIWVFDGKNAKKARRDIYPEYKAKRIPGSDEFYQTMAKFKELLRFSSKMQIEIPGYEGDDVIAALVKQSPPEQSVLIHANDADYHILCGPNVKMTVSALPKIAPAEARLYKTLVGDPGDNIPGLKGFGKGAWEDLQPQMKEKWVHLFTNPIPAKLPSAVELGLSDKIYNAFLGSCEQLCDFWQIVGFLPLSDEMINKHLVMGTNNYAAANALLKGLMQ